MSIEHLSTLDTLLRRRADRTPERVPLRFLESDGSETGFTYAELLARAEGIAAALSTRTEPGQRALLAYPTGPEFAAAFFGCLMSGVIAVPVPPPVAGVMAERYGAIRDDCAPALVLTVAQWLPLFDPEQAPSGAVEAVATDRIAAGAAVGARRSRQPGDIAYLQYSSGTTGTPRGAVITHANVLADCEMASAAAGFDRRFTMVGWLPHFHDFGLFLQILVPIYDDRTAVITDPQRFLRDPEEWLRQIARRGRCFVALPSFCCDLLLRRIPPERRAEFDVSAAVFDTAAEALDEQDLRAFTVGFGLPATAMTPTYGLVEGVSLVTHTDITAVRTSRWIDRKALAAGTFADGEDLEVVACGRPARGVRVRIGDPVTRAALAEGRVGEILISGPNVTPGYWGRPDPSVVLDGERYLPTGDLGALVDGELFVLGRCADLIVLDGGQHYPFDIERTVARLRLAARIRLCIAFADEHGVVVVVEAALDSDSDRSAAAVVAAVAEAVETVHGVSVSDVVVAGRGTIPVTTSGKPRRQAARAAYLSARERSAAAR